MADKRATGGKSKKAADPALEKLATLVQTLRTLHLATGGHQPWLRLDLSMAQFKSVLLLVFTGGMTSRGLADLLGVGPSAVTPLIDRLVDQNLVKREVDEADRRVIWLRPTAHAHAMQDDLMQTSRTLMAEVLEGLSSKERAVVTEGLTLLLERAQEVLGAHRPSA
jgi:MarR family transcriptional regulator, organic hydroperoxide resistance regulator